MIDEQTNVRRAGLLAASCMFCAHANPAGSKFCNECGSPLHLRPCVFCNAINNAAATHCHACDAAFPLRSAEPTSEPVQATAEPVTGDGHPVASTRAPRPRLAYALIVLLFVVAAPAAYYVYLQTLDRVDRASVPGPAIPADGDAAPSSAAATDHPDRTPPPLPTGNAVMEAVTVLPAEPPQDTKPAAVDSSPSNTALDGTPAMEGGGSALAARTDKAPATTAKTKSSGSKRTTAAKAAGKSTAKSPAKSSRSSRATGAKSAGTSPVATPPLEAGGAANRPQ